MDFWIIFFIFVLVVALAIYFRTADNALFYGAAESLKEMYHGSPQKLNKLTPQKHSFRDYPILFGTPSYTDAVIYSAAASEYVFSMSSENGVRIIEEMYPGAFDILKQPTYVHHMHADSFEPLGSGSTAKYISKKAQVPLRVDKIVPYDYLVALPAAEFKMIDHVTSLKIHNEPQDIRMETINNTNNNPNDILFHVTTLDDKSIVGKKEIDLLVAEVTKNITTRPIKLINIYALEKKLTSDCYYIIVGDDTDNGIRIQTNRPKIYLPMNPAPFMELGPTLRYFKYLTARPRYFNHWRWLRPSKSYKVFASKLAAQVRLREQWPDLYVVSVFGVSGAGKTTLCRRMQSFDNTLCIDSDDITDINIGKVAHDAEYIRLNDMLSQTRPKILIICGLTIDLSYFHNTLYYLDVPPVQIYKQLTARTLDDICNMRGEIVFNGNTVDELQQEFRDLTTRGKIRNPGLLPPADHINNDIIPIRANALASGAIPRGADEIYAEITSRVASMGN